LHALEWPLERGLSGDFVSQDVDACLDQALNALDVMQCFVQTRKVAYLNQAWLALSPAMEGMRHACSEAGMPQPKTKAPNQICTMFDTTDWVELTDPNE
jgi:hypothetical protein